MLKLSPWLHVQTFDGRRWQRAMLLVALAALYLLPLLVQPGVLIYPASNLGSDLALSHWPEFAVFVRYLRAGAVPPWDGSILLGRPLVGGAALWFAHITAVGALVWQIGFYPWQREMRAASDWIARTPETTRSASFNAGIYAYYSGRTVLNLDGVVNTEAFRAVRERALAVYLQRSGVTWLVDYDHAIQREYAPFIGAGYPQALREVAVLGGQADGPLGLLRAYRVQPSP